MQGSLRVNRFNPYEGYVGSESVGQDILIAGRVAMNRALDGDIVAVELLPEEQWVRCWQKARPLSLQIITSALGQASSDGLLILHCQPCIKMGA